LGTLGAAVAFRAPIALGALAPVDVAFHAGPVPPRVVLALFALGVALGAHVARVVVALTRAGVVGVVGVAADVVTRVEPGIVAGFVAARFLAPPVGAPSFGVAVGVA